MKKEYSGVSVNNRNEAVMLTMTSLQAFFTGTFFASWFIGLHVLYFQTFSAADLPQALILSGIFGMLYFSAYSYISSRINFRPFIAGNLLFVFILSLVSVLFFDRLSNVSVFGFPLFLPFIFLFPVTHLIVLVFKKSSVDILTPAQHRRMYPALFTSLLWGTIISSFSILALLFTGPDVFFILYISTAAAGMALIMQININFVHKNIPGFRPAIKKSNLLRSKFHEFFYTKYTLFLLAFILISATAGFVLHYYFIAESQIHYTNSLSLAKFFSFFTGTMFAFIFFIQKFLIRKILYTYDSPYSLILVPAVLGLAFIASVITDLIAGTSAAIATISFVFLVVSILRIGYETTSQAIEMPSLRVLSRTLDLRFIESITTRMEGSFRMIGLLLAGVAIYLTGFLDLRQGIALNLLLILLAFAWVPVTIVLIKTYQNSLRDAIRRLKTSRRLVESELFNTDEKIHELLNRSDSGQVLNTLSLIERIEPLKYEMHLLSLLGTSTPEVRSFIIKKIEDSSLLSSLPRLKELDSPGKNRQINSQLSRLINRFEFKLAVGISEDSLSKLVNSINVTDRVLAAEIIGTLMNQAHAESLTQLSRDIEPDVKFSAIKAMTRLAHPEHAYILIGYLNTALYYPYAFEALVKIGDPALQHLERTFLMPDADNTLLSRVVRIYGKIGSAQAIELLLGKLENQTRIIMHQAILALRESKFQSTPANINRILNDIVRLINIMSWNFAAYSSLGNSQKYSMLKVAFESEIKDNYNLLFHLLALAYNPTSIANIRNLIYDGSDQDISYAVELLDQIVHEEIKQVFLPVVENISYNERFRQLRYYFHAEKMDASVLIPEIITRDFNSVSLYIKACAIFNLLDIPGQKATQELIACLFHPDQLLRESAAYVIDKLEPDTLESVMTRIDSQLTGEIRQSLMFSGNGIPYLLLDRIRFLKDCQLTAGLPEDVLLEIVKHLEVHNLMSEDEFLIKQNDVHYAFMIIFDGKAEIKISTDKVHIFGKKDIIYSDYYIEDGTFSLKALTDLKFFSLDQEVLNSLMFDYIEFRNSILSLIELKN